MLTKAERSKRDLLTFQEAGAKSGILPRTLIGRVRYRSLRSYQRNGKTFVTLEDIAEWQPLWEHGQADIVREGHATGESDVAIAARMGLSRERVRQIRNSLGLPPNPLKPRLPKTLLEVFTLPKSAQNVFSIIGRRLGEGMAQKRDKDALGRD
jgi:hypothetical protein